MTWAPAEAIRVGSRRDSDPLYRRIRDSRVADRSRSGVQVAAHCRREIRDGGRLVNARAAATRGVSGACPPDGTGCCLAPRDSDIGRWVGVGSAGLMCGVVDAVLPGVVLDLHRCRGCSDLCTAGLG